jgi:hypothetical protein
MSELDARFETEMVEKVYRTAGKETGYWASYFLRAVRRHGGVETARRLLRQKGPSKGLVKLGEKGRLDLAMEALVLDPAFASLFSDEERATAARRLDEARALTAHAG